MTAWKKTLLGILLASGAVEAQDCSDRWRVFFETDPLKPKVMSGDTVAGYAVYSFWGNPNVDLLLRANFPHARFTSYETHDTRLSINEDALFDHEIEPDAGSENPFREGVDLATPNRAYTVRVTQHKTPGAVNTIALPQGRKVHVLMLRIYAPSGERVLTSADLPKMTAVDAATGTPVACPRTAGYPVRWHFPQFLATAYASFHPFEFTAPDMNMFGLNKGASYVYALTNLPFGDVAVARFRAPSFVDTTSGQGTFSNAADTRYWSFCTNNLPNNETWNCLPDWLARPHADGYVYVAVGRDKEVEAAAKERGYSFLPDARKARNRALGFVYRNLMPNEQFRDTTMYRGEYLPTAQLCPRAEFLANQCGW